METMYILSGLFAFLMLVCGLLIGYKFADLKGKKKSELLMKALNKERQEASEVWREKQWLAEELVNKGNGQFKQPDYYRPGWVPEKASG